MINKSSSNVCHITSQGVLTKKLRDFLITFSFTGFRATQFLTAASRFGRSKTFRSPVKVSEALGIHLRLLSRIHVTMLLQHNLTQSVSQKLYVTAVTVVTGRSRGTELATPLLLQEARSESPHAENTGFFNTRRPLSIDHMVP